MDGRNEMPKLYSIHQLPAEMLHSSALWLHINCRPSLFLYSLGDSALPTGSSGNATKLSSPLNFLFELVISSVDCSKGVGSTSSIESANEMLSREESMPQPDEVNSDFGQSFLWY